MNLNIKRANYCDVEAIIALLANDPLGKQREVYQEPFTSGLLYCFCEGSAGVRIDESYRGRGIGKLMIEWTINKIREFGCHLVQLTIDKQRLETLGFIASYEGMKLHL